MSFSFLLMDQLQRGDDPAAGLFLASLLAADRAEGWDTLVRIFMTESKTPMPPDFMTLDQIIFAAEVDGNYVREPRCVASLSSEIGITNGLAVDRQTQPPVQRLFYVADQSFHPLKHIAKQTAPLLHRVARRRGCS
ncbi:MAG: hypothetical protein U5N55_11180 [Cypionkella sp.]|nr:hypothetical protein [Cypionkella sp.]